MRLKITKIRSRVNGQLALRFTGKGITSFAGLELFRVFLQVTSFSATLQKHFRNVNVGGDYPVVAMVRLIITMLLAGATRLSHVSYLKEDPIIGRLCGLQTLPDERTIGRWLSRCNNKVRQALLSLNAELVANGIRPFLLKRLTIDVDGSVISAGLLTERAFRGYNPHKRNTPSYYPITAHLAQTGHILRVKNRSGDIHDGKASLPFLRELFSQVQELDSRALVETRLDGAFFRREVITFLESRSEYAIKVPFYKWLGLKKLIQQQKEWKPVRADVEAFSAEVLMPKWKRSLRVIIYRKRVKHKSTKNYQLDLFDPTDGYWEYSAITTNKTLSPRYLWDFLSGRGCHEKVYGELKQGYAFATIPCRSYAANSTWQILSAMAHNLMVNFQIAAGAPRRRQSSKRAPIVALKRIKTLRFELFSRAGIIQRPNGRTTLTLSKNMPTRRLFERAMKNLNQNC